MEEYRINGEFIELHDLLKVMGIFSTGGMAKAAIAEGFVIVDGNVEKRKRCKIKSGQIIQYNERTVKVVARESNDGCGLNGKVR
jgi:ribosome-associated protein